MSANAKPAASPPLLSIRDLHTQFVTSQGIIRAVDGVSLDIREGEVLGLVGESGCGKSVTCLSIMRLVADPPGRIVRGEILFRGHNLLSMPESEMRRVRGDEISMVFQDPMSSLNPTMTVGRQIREVLELHREGAISRFRDEVVRLLGVVGLPDPSQCYDSYPHELSGGMRQRVMVAMALACDPSLLIADEPTSSLDVTIQSQILDLINALCATVGKSVLLVSHDLGVVAGLASRVAVMYAGRIVESAGVEALFAQPQHPYTRGLLRTIPRLDGVSPIEPVPGRPPNPLSLPGGCPFRPRCALAHEPCAGAYPPEVQVASDHTVACWAAEGQP